MRAAPRSASTRPPRRRCSRGRIALGADIVMHSATKYLNGHSDVIAGVLATARDDKLWARIRQVRGHHGAILGPFEAWLLLRGLRTLDVRVRAQTESAALLAHRFANHASVSAVLYPGLPTHPGHAVAVKQMSGFGGMLSIRVKAGERAAIDAAARVEIWKRATSLGGVESLIEHRASIEGAGSPCPTDLLRLVRRSGRRRRSLQRSRSRTEGRQCLERSPASPLPSPCAISAAQAQVTLDLINEYPATSLPGEADAFFAKAMEAKTGGRVTINPIPDAKSGLRTRDQLKAVTDGKFAMADSFGGALGDDSPVFLLSSLPFVTPSMADARILFELALPLYEKLFAERRQKLLYVVPWPPSGIWSAIPVTSVDALKSLKIRTYDKTSTDVLSRVAASATIVSFSDLNPKLEAGDINAVLSSGDGGAGRQLWKYRAPVLRDQLRGAAELRLDIAQRLGRSRRCRPAPRWKKLRARRPNGSGPCSPPGWIENFARMRAERRHDRRQAARRSDERRCAPLPTRRSPNGSRAPVRTRRASSTTPIARRALKPRGSCSCRQPLLDLVHRHADVVLVDLGPHGVAQSSNRLAAARRAHAAAPPRSSISSRRPSPPHRAGRRAR